MQLETVTAEIRPRSDWEAVDLGLAMVRRDFWRCFTVWWLAMALPVALAGWWLWNSPVWWLILFWWLKPAGSRMVLFEISRRLFGEQPAWRDALREVPRVWTRRFFHRFIWARFSPWRPVTLAVEDLERLKGKTYRQRCVQVSRRGESPIMWLYFVGNLSAVWFGLAFFMLIVWLIPEGQDGAWRAARESWNPELPFDIPPLILRAGVTCIMLAMALADVFVTGAGFGIYVNNRTWIEGWDVELAFRRIGRRLARTVAMIALGLLFFLPAPVRAAAERDPAVEIQEVKEHPDFKVHKVVEKKFKSIEFSMPWLERFFRWLFGNRSWKGGSWSFGGMQMLAWTLVVSVAVILLGLIAWIIWSNRHAFLIRMRGGAGDDAKPRAARVVMGMEVSPETLPSNVPDAAWILWQNGRHREALGLLYRGAISKVIEIGRVEIQESDTEGDCLRRVDGAGAMAHPDYFRGITRIWTGLAYAGLFPDERAVESLCRNWPFVEGRET